MDTLFYCNLNNAFLRKQLKKILIKIDTNRNLEMFLSEFSPYEAGVLARLNHPNIIKYFETFISGNNYYRVTELCEVCMPIDLLKLF